MKKVKIQTFSTTMEMRASWTKKSQFLRTMSLFMRTLKMLTRPRNTLLTSEKDKLFSIRLTAMIRELKLRALLTLLSSSRLRRRRRTMRTNILSSLRICQLQPRPLLDLLFRDFLMKEKLFSQATEKLIRKQSVLSLKKIKKLSQQILKKSVLRTCLKKVTYKVSFSTLA